MDRIDQLLSAMNFPLLNREMCYFTFNSVPLKWNLPLGLLYDLNDQDQVWRLRLEDAPLPDSILPLHKDGAMFDLYMSMVKEVAFYLIILGRFY